MQPKSRPTFAALTGSSLIYIAACAPPAPDAAAVPTASCGLSPDLIGTFVDIPPGAFEKGTSPLYPEEQPTLRLQVSGFAIQAHEVTTEQFARFVDETGYVTDAERSRADGRLGAGSAVFLHPESRAANDAPWTLIDTASWKAPRGESGSTAPADLTPVVHVSKRDAEAYAIWAGGRLPSEVEWEYAATLGLPNPDNSRSGAYDEDGPRANTWQGIFPIEDRGEDGFTGAAPVGCFEPDRLGLYDMIGNVWEWTDTPYAADSHTIKGGSFLCADNFCRRYRPAARQPQETDFSSNHIGFRIVRDLETDATGAD